MFFPFTAFSSRLGVSALNWTPIWSRLNAEAQRRGGCHAEPQTTLKRYFARLEATFLVQLLRPWSSNLGQRLIQTPKVYLDDTVLLAHLLGLTLDRLKVDAALAGGVLDRKWTSCWKTVRGGWWRLR